VEANLFATPNRLTLSNNGVLAVASEGELFPHDPGNKIFDFVIAFDQNANFDSELCYSVTIVVKPNSSTKPINRNAKGKLPVAILLTADFDATTFLGADIQIAGVSPSHVAIQDVNGDGLDDLVCQFSIPSLKSAGALDVGDTELILDAVLDDDNGSCIHGTDS